MKKFLLQFLGSLSALSLLIATQVWARTQCDRNIHYSSLPEQTKLRLQNGEMVSVADPNTDSPFHIGYVYKILDWDAELVMAILTSYNEQQKRIRGVEKSIIEEQKANFARVRYELNSGRWYIPNFHYAIDHFLKVDSNSYLLEWNLHRSSGFPKLEYTDGYARAEPLNARTVLIYCSYAVPNIKLAPSEVNTEGAVRLRQNIEDIAAWVDQIGQDPEQERLYRWQFREKNQLP